MSADVTSLAPSHRTRPFYWSVRRELWENRAIHTAPLIAAGVVLLGVVISLLHPLVIERAHDATGPHTGQRLPPEAPYYLGAIVISATAFLVGAFYCLGALHGERRDRSILFWKSLPVPDSTAVLAKAAVPTVLLPLIAFAVIAATQILILAIAALGAAVHGGQGLAGFLTRASLGDILAPELYQMAATIPWYAPIWAWLLMVSAWARRMTVLWGVGPPLAACVVERLAFGTTDLLKLLAHRLGGVRAEAFDLPSRPERMADLPPMDPAKFLASPGLWGGLAFAAACLVVAVWLRRRQEPI